MAYQQLVVDNIDVNTINRAAYVPGARPSAGAVNAINVSNGSGGWTDTTLRLPTAVPASAGQVLTSGTPGATTNVSWVTPVATTKTVWSASGMILSSINDTNAPPYIFGGGDSTQWGNIITSLDTNTAGLTTWTGSANLAGKQFRINATVICPTVNTANGVYNLFDPAATGISLSMCEVLGPTTGGSLGLSTTFQVGGAVTDSDIPITAAQLNTPQILKLSATFDYPEAGVTTHVWTLRFDMPQSTMIDEIGPDKRGGLQISATIEQIDP